MIKVILSRAVLVALAMAVITIHERAVVRAQSCNTGTCPNACNPDNQPCIDVEGVDCLWEGAVDYCAYPDNGCSRSWYWNDGNCCYLQITPILIDVAGNGFSLSGAAAGVWFPITATDSKYHVSWPNFPSKNAWLALDRNGDGVIDNGSELFGNFTSQPKPTRIVQTNGFRALAVFDQPENGGNSDGIIDERDAVFSHLILWEDKNRNGRSEPGEMVSLRNGGVHAIELAYTSSKVTDDHGNVFRFRSRIVPERGFPDGRWAWDVDLVHDGEKP